MQPNPDAQVSGGMRALLDNLETLARNWDQTPAGLLAMAGLSTALYWQWKQGSSALVSKIDRLAQRLGMTTPELLTPGFVESLVAEGELTNPFAQARAALAEGIRKPQRARTASFQSQSGSRVSTTSKRARGSQKSSKPSKRRSPIIPARLTCAPLRRRQAPSDALPTPYSQVAA